MPTTYRAQVKLKNENSTLNVRDTPSIFGRVINELNHGTVVSVQVEYENKWRFVFFGDGCMGYVHGNYLEQIEEENFSNNEEVFSNDADDDPNNMTAENNNSLITIVDSEGNQFRPVGSFKVYRGSID